MDGEIATELVLATEAEVELPPILVGRATPTVCRTLAPRARRRS